MKWDKSLFLFAFSSNKWTNHFLKEGEEEKRWVRKWRYRGDDILTRLSCARKECVGKFGRSQRRREWWNLRLLYLYEREKLTAWVWNVSLDGKCLLWVEKVLRGEWNLGFVFLFIRASGNNGRVWRRQEGPTCSVRVLGMDWVVMICFGDWTVGICLFCSIWVKRETWLIMIKIHLIWRKRHQQFILSTAEREKINYFKLVVVNSDSHVNGDSNFSFIYVISFRINNAGLSCSTIVKEQRNF